MKLLSALLALCLLPAVADAGGTRAVGAPGGGHHAGHGTHAGHFHGFRGRDAFFLPGYGAQSYGFAPSLSYYQPQLFGGYLGGECGYSVAPVAAVPTVAVAAAPCAVVPVASYGVGLASYASFGSYFAGYGFGRGAFVHGHHAGHVGRAVVRVRR